MADTGIGIAPEDLKSLFGDFSRIRPNSAVEGTGLGLAICKEYAELLGGRIDVFSEAEQGTRFEVRLPWTAEVNTFGDAILSSVLGSKSPGPDFASLGMNGQMDKLDALASGGSPNGSQRTSVLTELARKHSSCAR